jgi:hypothetical protein
MIYIKKWKDAMPRRPMVSPDIVLDSGTLADFLAQYFGPAERGQQPFQSGGRLSPDLARQLNSILTRYTAYQTVTTVVVASTLAFVEIVRQWDQIVQDRFQPHQVAAFLEQPPDWFSVAPVDEDLIEFFCDVPAHVSMPDGIIRPVEWTDAVHAATVFSRDETCLFATSDLRLRQIVSLNGRFI